MVNMQAAQPQALPPPPRDGLRDFQCTKPLTFSHVVEPMDVDDWLKSIEKKLQVVQCNNHEKVLLASHQLFGPTTDWSDGYMESHKNPKSMNWLEFRAAFRAHHIPPRSHKAEEGVSRSQIGVHVCERVHHQVHPTVSLHPA
jgi:hypothetical protein